MTKRSRGKRFIKQSGDADDVPNHERWDDVHSLAETKNNKKGKRS
ncbi:hypothetical protein [Bacillus shivajii]|nr:hypothetical protein [Bacillus shivajii]